jgi:hypothetical protein
VGRGNNRELLQAGPALRGSRPGAEESREPVAAAYVVVRVERRDDGTGEAVASVHPATWFAEMFGDVASPPTAETVSGPVTAKLLEQALRKGSVVREARRLLGLPRRG